MSSGTRMIRTLRAFAPGSDRIAQRFSAVFARHPIRLAVGLSAAKAGFADVLTQTYFEGNEVESADLTRTATFIIFGGAYQGGFQYFLWNHVFERIFPGARPVMSIAKVVASNTVGDIVFFFPTFYSIQQLLRSREAILGDPSELSNVVPAALGRYYQNCVDDWFMSWKVWVPGHFVTYFLAPQHLRVPWAASVSFGYVCILSRIRGRLTSR